MTEGLAAALSGTQRSFEVQSFHRFRGKYFLTKSLIMNECIKLYKLCIFKEKHVFCIKSKYFFS